MTFDTDVCPDAPVTAVCVVCSLEPTCGDEVWFEEPAGVPVVFPSEEADPGPVVVC